jgi:DNA transposition AAA+ family ATPase
VEASRRDAEGPLARARQQDAASQQACFLKTIETLYNPPSERPARPESRVVQVAKTSDPNRVETPEPTTVLLMDATARLKTAGLAQVRDIFDQGGLGVVLIGRPSVENRCSRYPPLASRGGFVQAVRPLSPMAVRHRRQDRGLPSGVALPEASLADEETLAAISRLTGGNFRLLHRLLTQMARLVELNA